jgi:hypothetical protein
MRALLVRLLAFLLIAEAMFGALRVANLLPRLAAYDAIALVLIVARGLIGALQIAAGWMIATHRPQGRTLGQAALAAAALITVFDVGFGLAPTDVYAWLRWQVTAAYGAYAAAAIALLRRRVQ